jgi:hypothetical protein
MYDQQQGDNDSDPLEVDAPPARAGSGKSDSAIVDQSGILDLITASSP